MLNKINHLQASLEIRDLSKRYGENAFVISGMNHVFESGTATGLTGANGAGKTTFLRILSAAAFPSGGEVLYGDIKVHSHVQQYLSDVGIVGDTSELPQFLTAEELVEGVMRSRGVTTDIPSKMKALFESVELDERRSGLIGTYSSGMMQKTMIAAALAGNPKILLLDEPFRALDESSVRSVMQLLQEFKRTGGIVLISSHQRSVLEELCDSYVDFPYLK